jgi:hypothetical protein
MTSEELEALEKLEQAATPGPWVYERSPGDMEVGYPDQFDVIAPNGDALCSMFTSDWGLAETHGKLIPALRNAAPALIAAARENAKLRERVEWLEFRAKVLDSTEAESVQFLTAENARLRAVVEAARDEITAWRAAEDDSRAIENAYGLNTARAYIARARDAFDKALSALDAKETP